MYSIVNKKNADYRYTISKTTQARGITYGHGPNHVKENIDIKVQNGGRVPTLF